MKEAIESNGGISGVQVFVCASQEQTDEDTTPIENISQLTNFEYVEEGILVWKACNLGTPSLIPIKQKKAPQLNILVSTHNPQYAFKGVLHPRPVFGLFLHFSQKLQHIGNK